jgi:hypothetical protein
MSEIHIPARLQTERTIRDDAQNLSVTGFAPVTQIDSGSRVIDQEQIQPTPEPVV